MATEGVVKPNKITYSALISACGREGKWQGALKVNCASNACEFAFNNACEFAFNNACEFASNACEFASNA
eukprot:1062060-Prorocentrum_minimum.AAC.1